MKANEDEKNKMLGWQNIAFSFAKIFSKNSNEAYQKNSKYDPTVNSFVKSLKCPYVAEIIFNDEVIPFFENDIGIAKINSKNCKLELLN